MVAGAEAAQAVPSNERSLRLVPAKFDSQSRHRALKLASESQTP
jgi:hypothetical protein